jgi:hypothetical protein
MPDIRLRHGERLHHVKPLFILLLLVGFDSALAAESDVQWYSLSIAGRGEVAATCDLTPSELSASLAQNHYVRLDRFREMSTQGKWIVALPPFTDTQYVRADTVKAFSPMSGKPKDVELNEVTP